MLQLSIGGRLNSIMIGQIYIMSQLLTMTYGQKYRQQTWIILKLTHYM